VTLRGPLSAAAITAACDEVDLLMRQGRAVVVRVTACDLSVVDAVARLRVLARRYTASLDVAGADEELFSACGLEDVL